MSSKRAISVRATELLLYFLHKIGKTDKYIVLIVMTIKDMFFTHLLNVLNVKILGNGYIEMLT